MTIQTGPALAIGVKSNPYGGDQYAVGTRGLGFGRAQVFPLNPAGWDQAWAVFEAGDPEGAAQYRARARDHDQMLHTVRTSQVALSETVAVAFATARCAFLTGYNIHPFDVGAIADLVFGPEDLSIFDARTAEKMMTITYHEMIDVALSGNGATANSANVVGGGAGVTGALTGLAVAAVINKMTTRNYIENVIEVRCADRDLVWLNDDLESRALQIALMPVRALVRARADRVQREPLVVQLDRVAALFREGLLTDVEFDVAKQGILREWRVEDRGAND